MKPSDTQAAIATTEEQKELDLEAMEDEAAKLAKEVSALDAQMAEIKLQRTAKHKELRAITSKIVTVKLRAAK
jgi:hypothetical protein